MEDPSTTSTFARDRHWLIYAPIYALILFLLIYQPAARNFVSMIFAVAIILVTAELVAIWCVYSAGGFVSRVFKGFVWAAIVLTGGLAAVLLNPAMPKEGIHVALAVAYMFPVFCIAFQIPHWPVRFFFGWQFAFDGQQPGTATFKLSDLFFVTLVVAVALCGVQLAASSYMKIIPDEALSEIRRFDLEGNPSSQPLNRSEFVKGASLFFLMYSIAATVWATAKLPILFFIFSGRFATKALINTGVFMIVGVVCLYAVVSWTTGTMASIVSGFGVLAAFGIISVLAQAIPLFHSRLLGMEFVRYSGENSVQQQFNIEDNCPIS